jgi:hypothetical protein
LDEEHLRTVGFTPSSDFARPAHPASTILEACVSMESMTLYGSNLAKMCVSVQVQIQQTHKGRWSGGHAVAFRFELADFSI